MRGGKGLAETKFYPYGVRVCVIKVMSYEGRNPRGVLQNPTLEQDQGFENLTQLLFSMDALLDNIGSPQRTMRPRSLAEKPETEAQEDAAELPKGKPLATFRVDVIFRQNASWQGGIAWLEGRRETQFRSVLELVQIMDSVLSSGGRSRKKKA